MQRSEHRPCNSCANLTGAILNASIVVWVRHNARLHVTKCATSVYNCTQMSTKWKKSSAVQNSIHLHNTTSTCAYPPTHTHTHTLIFLMGVNQSHSATVLISKMIKYLKFDTFLHGTRYLVLLVSHQMAVSYTTKSFLNY